MNALGIDPGVDGAAVLLVERKVALICFWSRTKEGWYDYRRWIPGSSELERTLIPGRAGAVGVKVVHDLAGVLGGWNAEISIACEDFFLGKNPSTLIKISRWGGAIMSQIEEVFGRQAEWVRGDEWRAPILGLKRGTERDVAKDASRRLMVARLPALKDLLDKLTGETSHICDAAGIAQWAELEKRDAARPRQSKAHARGAVRKPRHS